ncbi:hypothetical protein EJ02DRAFT_514301 [Clathrospora elynae]|uniref:Uncharacterized protein n=1 Tax=Clathrospora elynae TaxID=706981 RepID=A0A6A5SHD0_9PLEO|nr:hypothetical protein EJ02DRAFT_514301 [Clathrospora elynae]
MSQDQIPKQRQSYPPEPETTMRRRAFVGPTPNMLPFNPTATFGAGAASNQYLSPKMPSQTSLTGPDARFLAFPDLAYPFSNPYPIQPPPGPASGLARESAISMPISNSFTLAQERRRLGLDKGDPSPDNALPPDAKRCHLPSNNAPRKAPLPADTSPLSGAADIFSISTPDGKKSAKPSKLVQTKRPAKDIKRVKARAFAQLGQPISKTGILKLANRSRRQSTTRNGSETATPSISTRSRPVVTHEEEGYEDDELETPQPPIEPNRPTADEFPSSPRRPSIRLKYTYTVPPELEGTRKALGEDNWNEYVFLMERLCTNKITPQEFNKGTRPIFLTLDEKMRKKMDNMVAMNMIQPGLDQQWNRDEESD